MTDNEQYVPTGASARVRHIFAKEWGGDYVQGAAEFDRAMADVLAAHRVTLEAESREALAKGLYLAHREDATPWEHVGLEFVEYAREKADALLASGVVSVTEPVQDEALHEAVDSARDIRAVWTERKTNGSRTPIQAGDLIARMLDDHVALLRDLASRPAPVAPPTEEWATTVEELDALPQDSIVGTTVAWKARDKAATYGGGRFWTGAANDRVASKESHQMTLPIRILYRPDQKPFVPVDALGFPTQEGATFTALYLSDVSRFRNRFQFRVVETGLFENALSLTRYRPTHLDHTSIEDVRPVDGRNGQ